MFLVVGCAATKDSWIFIVISVYPLALLTILCVEYVIEHGKYEAWLMSFYDNGDDIPHTSLTLDFIKRCLTLLYETPITRISQLRELRRGRRHDSLDVEMIQ